MDVDTIQAPSEETSAPSHKFIRLSGNSELEVRAYFFTFVLSYFAKVIMKSGIKSVDYVLLSQASTEFLESLGQQNKRTLDFFQVSRPVCGAI